MTRLAPVVFALAALAGCTSTTTQVSKQSDAGFVPQASAAQKTDQARDRARIHTELASGYYEIGSMAIALDEVREALASDSNYGPAYNVAGLIYAELKEDKIAQENFQRALRINPLDSDANNNYGRFLCDRKREDEAIRYFLAALRNPLYQSPERSYVNAGLCSRRRGDIATAESYFQQALKTRPNPNANPNPNQAQALYQLAEIAYARGNYGVSKDYLNRFGQVASANAEVLWLALRVERKLGDRDAAESYGTMLKKNFPDSKEAGALLAGRFE